MDFDAASSTRPCSTTTAFHYRPGAGIETLLARGGLRPLSALPDHPKHQQTVRDQPDRFSELWRDLAEPLLGREYRNSGIYFTTIDFWKHPFHRANSGTGRVRVAVPIGRLDPATTVLTYVRDGCRIHEHPTAGALERAARFWTAERIQASLGIDRRGWFFPVPQLIAFTDLVHLQPPTSSDSEHVPRATQAPCSRVRACEEIRQSG